MLTPKTKSNVTVALLLFLSSLLLYSLTAYGGVRSPDAEMIFRVGQSLADGRGFTVEAIDIYPRFGVAPGEDGRLYSIYPPFSSLALVPVIKMAEAVNSSGWYEGMEPPLSHYVDRGLWRILRGEPAGDRQPHALRFLASFFNVVVSALCVALFFMTAARMLRSTAAAVATALLYACGSLAWPYSGTMFSEPLAMLFVLASFYLIVLLDGRFGGGGARTAPLLLALSGLALGIAAATHLTALLFVPFFYLYARGVIRGKWLRGGAGFWLGGVALVLSALGWYNFSRFGSLLESGRSLSGLNPVLFHHPLAVEFWRGLYGSLVGGGKGLLLFCPAVLLGALGWRAMARRNPLLGLTLGAAILFRVLFAASYYDWHGGFCLGPRYLLLAVPFLLLPFGFWCAEQIESGRWQRLALAALASWLLMAQQLYFALGDIFRYYHAIKIEYLDNGLDVFAGDKLYLDWSLSPLLHLLEYPRGPFLLQSIPLSNMALWGAGSALLLIAVVAVSLCLRARAASPG
jgi:hypothetical protein